MATHPFQNFMVRYGSGERIYTENELANSMFIVQSGKVRMFRMKDDDKHILGEMEKGDFFGEMSILEGLPRTFSAEALEDVELIEINSMTFDKMIKSNIEIAIRMLRKLSIRCREMERRLVEASPVAGKTVSGSTPARPARAPVSAEPSTGPRLKEEEGESPVTFALAESSTLIGRYDPVTEMRPDVDLTQLDLKRSVSRRHALLLAGDDGYSLTEEVGALNGTFVNGNRLVTGQPQALEDGDSVCFGMVKLVFHLQ
jgi:CRP-like cAMP-binding protein